MNRPAQLQTRLPCAVLRLWWLDGREETRLARFPLPEGTYDIGPGAYAVIPWHGDPAVYDAATDWARQLALGTRSEGRNVSTDPSLLAVIYPGVVNIDGDRVRLEPDDLDSDLADKRPEFEAGIYLSGRASKVLEYIPSLASSVSYQGPSGKLLPFLRFEGPQYDAQPWRNPEVLGQSTKFVARKGLSDSLSQLLRETVTRVSGPLGCGKSRLVWQVITERNGMRLWIRARPPRIESPIVSEQVITQLLIPSKQQLRDPYHPRFDAKIDSDQIRDALSKRSGQRSEAEIRLLNERATVALGHLARTSDRPVWIVIDDFHQISPQDLAFLEHLLEAVDLKIFRFALVGRSGSPWPETLEPFPLLDVPPFEDAEMEEFSGAVTDGLSLPDAVKQRFLKATRGYPFAFEEGLFALVHEKHLRRIYGSFFFGGSDDLDYQPSARLVRHVEAEVSRLGEPLPVRLLSITEHPVPASELASAASILGETVSPGWERPFLEAQILENVQSPWGRAVGIISGVNRRALSHSLPPERATAARRALGELLSFGGTDGGSHWHSYQLLAGTPQAIESLLKLFKTRSAQELPPGDLLAALERELNDLRERRNDKAPKGAHSGDGDDAETAELELELLWRLLPLARKLGRLSQYENELVRGVALSAGQPQKLLALASIKAEQEQEAGRLQDAESTIQFALKGAGALEARHKALLLTQLGRLFLRQNRFVEAEQLFSNLLAALDEKEAVALAASCRFFLGNVALHRGDLDAAHTFHLEALEQRQKHQLSRSAGASLSALGTVATAQGNYQQALDYYRRSLEAFKEHSKDIEDPFALLGLARAYGRLGDFSSATKPARRALELRAGRDDVAGEAIARLAVAMNYMDLGNSDAALEEARKAHFQLTMSSADEQLAATEMTLGIIHLRQGRYADARRRFEEALRRFQNLDKTLETSFVLAYLIEASVAEEDAEAIREYTADLKNRLKKLPPLDQSEILDFRIYRGLDWLAEKGFKVGDPASFLARAYSSLISKAEKLPQELRQRYLFQIPANQEIVDSATRQGLTTAS